jgi:hypothetical protein
MMSRLLWATAALVVACVVLAAVFLALDFASGDATVGVSTHPEPYFVGLRQGESFPAGNALALQVSGDGALAPALRKALAAQLPLATTYGQITVLDVVTDRVSSAILTVDITSTKGVWTPVRATEDVGLAVAFASDGDVAWRDAAEVLIPAAADPTARIRLYVQAHATMSGLQSRPAFMRLVADKLAGDIAAELARQLGTEPPR